MTVLVLVVFAVYGYIALEAWNLSHPEDCEARNTCSRSRDIADLKVTAIEPLRVPAFEGAWKGSLDLAA